MRAGDGGRAGGPGGDERVEALGDDEPGLGQDGAGLAEVGGRDGDPGRPAQARVHGPGEVDVVAAPDAPDLPRLEDDLAAGGEDRDERRGQLVGEAVVAGVVGERDDDVAAARAGRGLPRGGDGPGGVGADAERGRRAGVGEHLRGLLVAQDEQARLADEAAGEQPAAAGPQRRGADADERERLAERAGPEAERERAGEQVQRRAAGGRAQLLEDRAAGEHDGVGGADAAHDGGRVAGGDGLAAGGRGPGARGDDLVAVERAQERVEEGVVARVALAERAGQDDAAHAATSS